MTEEQEEAKLLVENDEKCSDQSETPTDDNEKLIPQDPSTSQQHSCACKKEEKTDGSGAKPKRAPLSKQSSGESSSRGSSIDRSSPPLVSRATTLGEKRRQREDKNIEDIMKALSLLDTPEQKMAALCTKYAAVIEENVIMQKSLKETQKLYTAVVREKEQKDTELNRTLLAKIKLETLCRELQKMNKAIKEEGLEKLKQQEASRLELSEKFRTSLNEIHTAMASGKDRSDHLSEENSNLAKKLQDLADQYETKQGQSNKLMAARDLEVQLYEAKLQAASLHLQKATEEKLKEEHSLLLKLKERDDQLKESLESEKTLRDQMALYSAKYDELHTSLSDSNSTFEKFKTEMERMNSSLIKCERESRRWKGKFEETSKSLIDIAETKAQTEKKFNLELKRNEKLEKLCRTLQEERARLIKKSNSSDEMSEQSVADNKKNASACSQEDTGSQSVDTPATN